MNPTARETILSTASASEQGLLKFGQVVGQLISAGVESYTADFRTHKTTYYLPDGETLSVDLTSPNAQIAQAFDAAGIKAAILGAQSDTVRYPEFKRLAYLAGCVGYTVWIAGRHVSYYGRKGETHVERFPDQGA